jgi:hypothetical protein
MFLMSQPDRRPAHCGPGGRPTSGWSPIVRAGRERRVVDLDHALAQLQIRARRKVLLGVAREHERVTELAGAGNRQSSQNRTQILKHLQIDGKNACGENRSIEQAKKKNQQKSFFFL